jgi:hypothetical protein
MEQVCWFSWLFLNPFWLALFLDLNRHFCLVRSRSRVLDLFFARSFQPVFSSETCLPHWSLFALWNPFYRSKFLLPREPGIFGFLACRVSTQARLSVTVFHSPWFFWARSWIWFFPALRSQARRATGSRPSLCFFARQLLSLTGVSLVPVHRSFSFLLSLSSDSDFVSRNNFCRLDFAWSLFSFWAWVLAQRWICPQDRLGSHVLSLDSCVRWFTFLALRILLLSFHVNENDSLARLARPNFLKGQSAPGQNPTRACAARLYYGSGWVFMIVSRTR